MVVIVIVACCGVLLLDYFGSECLSGSPSYILHYQHGSDRQIEGIYQIEKTFMNLENVDFLDFLTSLIASQVLIEDIGPMIAIQSHPIHPHIALKTTSHDL